MKSKQTLKVEQKCEACEFILLSNPPKYKCKHCGQIWLCSDNTPNCRITITPKKVKKWKYDRESLDNSMDLIISHLPNYTEKELKQDLSNFKKDILAKSTPKKKSKEIEPISEGDMRCLDSERLIDKLWEKQCEVIDTINLLIKNK